MRAKAGSSHDIITNMPSKKSISMCPGEQMALMAKMAEKEKESAGAAVTQENVQMQ